MAGGALRRITMELRRMEKEPPEGVTAGPVDDSDMTKWTATIEGPKDTPYEGGMFVVSIVFPPEYPIRPPKVTFVTKVYHPNITKEGGVCLNILKDDWKPAISVPNLLQSIAMLLSTPNMEEALEADVVEAYKKDPKAFEATAREWTELYAKPE